MLVMDDEEIDAVLPITQENMTREDKEEQELFKMKIEEMIEENHSTKNKGAFNGGTFLDFRKTRQRGNSEHKTREDMTGKESGIFLDIDNSKSPRRIGKGDDHMNMRLSHDM